MFEKGTNEEEIFWNERFYNGIDLTERKSINFTNIKVNNLKKSRSSKKEVSKKLNSKLSSNEDIQEKGEISSKAKEKKNKKSTNKISLPWDISNFSLNYSFTELSHRDINTRQDLQRNYLGSVNYLYNSKVTPFEPFKKNSFIRKSKWLRFVRDFNI